MTDLLFAHVNDINCNNLITMIGQVKLPIMYFTRVLITSLFSLKKTCK